MMQAELFLQMTIITLASSFTAALEHFAFVQVSAAFARESQRTDVSTSTCSKWNTQNTIEACPQSQCYGDSTCCLATGACNSFSSTFCSLVQNCTNGPCGSASTGFPETHSEMGTAAYHSYEDDHDGCTCEKVVESCKVGTKSVCWGTLKCVQSGSCHETGFCRSGTEISQVGDFCLVLPENPVVFKFCSETDVGDDELPQDPSLTPASDSTTTANTDTTTTTTSCDTISCEVYNDPHIIAFDGSEDGPASLDDSVFLGSNFVTQLRSSTFGGHPAYFGLGDVWLIKSDLLSIQGRFVRSSQFKAGGSAMGAIAMGGIALDNNHLVIEPRNGSLTWSGHLLSFGAFATRVSHGDVKVLNGELDVGRNHPFNRVEIQLPFSCNLVINRYNDYLNVKITMPRVGNLASTIVGGTCGQVTDNLNIDPLSELEQQMDSSSVPRAQSFFA